MSAFCFWLSEYLLIDCREKYKENMETISIIERNAEVKKENTFVSLSIKIKCLNVNS